MPNYELIAAEFLKRNWEYEGETSDGTVLTTCPICGATVSENRQKRHADWHSRQEG